MVVFTYRGAPADCPWAVMAMCKHSANQGVEVRVQRYGNALIDAARNRSLVEVRPDADSVLFVDDDMLMAPDALLRLMAHEQPVVSAYCTTRPPVDLPFKVYDPKSDQFVPLYALKEGKLVQGQFAVGAAFLLVRRSTLGALVEHYLTAQDWLFFERRTLDRLHVRADLREKERARKEEIRRATFQADGYVRVFDRNLDANERRFGEDIDFSRKLVALQIPVAIDTGTVVAHISEYPYGPWDLDDDFFRMPAWLRVKVRSPLEGANVDQQD